MRQLSQVCRARRGAIGHRPYGQHIPRAGCQTAASGQDTALPFSCPAAVFLSGLLLFLLVDRVHVRERQRTPLTTRAIAPRIAPPSASNPPLLRCTSLDSSSELACIFCMHVQQSMYHGCLGTQSANDQKPNASVWHVFLAGCFSVPQFGFSRVRPRANYLDFSISMAMPKAKPKLGFLSVPNFRLLGVPKFGR